MTSSSPALPTPEGELAAAVTDVVGEPLTAADRCDRCGAAALVRAVLASGDLLLCGHHAREHAPALRPASLAWLDASGRAIVD